MDDNTNDVELMQRKVNVATNPKEIELYREIVQHHRRWLGGTFDVVSAQDAFKQLVRMGAERARWELQSD